MGKSLPGWRPEAAVTNKSGKQKLGWVDEARIKLEQTRKIRRLSPLHGRKPALPIRATYCHLLPRRQAELLTSHTDLVISPVPFSNSAY
ncbi:hypothetical protein P4S63_22300 [Pseudoalteromonas sp. B193]